LAYFSSDSYLLCCFDKTVTAHVLEGLTQNKIDFGSPLCPCRYYDNKQEEVNSSYWNCPCVPMRERKECHCMLFLTEDDEFFSKSQEISFEEQYVIFFRGSRRQMVFERLGSS
jgi:ferredoxin-thioredoxin reductase catalytic chain